MNNYTESAACKLLATHCCVCSRELVDAKSVELGIGPICRKKYGFDVDCDEATRKKVNALVYQVAAQQKDIPTILPLIERIKGYGFNVLAERLFQNIARIKVERSEDGKRFIVQMPGFKGMGQAMRDHGAPGKWMKDDKVWSIYRSPKTQKGLWSFFKDRFAGHVALGPNGSHFVIEEA